MSNTFEAIERLESYLARERPDFFNALLPGLTTNEINEIIQNFPYSIFHNYSAQ